MGKTFSARLSIVALLGLSTVNSACSLIFVKPPEGSGRIVRRDPNCTSSKVAPVLDTIFTGLQVLRTGLAASADKSVYENPDQPLSREADIGLGVGFTALFLGSAIYGYANTSRCAALEDEPIDDEQDTDAEWSTDPPAATAPAAPAPSAPAAAPTPAAPAPTQAPTEASPPPPTPEPLPTQNEPAPNAPPGSPVDAGPQPGPEAPR